MLLSSYLAATRAYCIFLLGVLLLSEWHKHQSREYPAAHWWQKKDVVALLFKHILLVIWFFLCINKVSLFLFQNRINVNIMVNVLNFMVETYLVVLFTTHRFHSCPFSLLVFSDCLIHGLHKGELPLSSPMKLQFTHWKLCSAYLPLHPLVGAWWWFEKNWIKHCTWIWDQG